MTFLTEEQAGHRNRIIDELNKYKQRATYKAVGDVIGGFHRNVMPPSGIHKLEICPINSWIVPSAPPHKPHGYDNEQLHHDFELNERVIMTKEELERELSNWSL